MPRQLVLTEQLVHVIRGAVAIGATVEEAAQASGIGRTTIFRWLERGRNPGPGDHLYVRLVEDVEQARGYRKIKLKERVDRWADKDARTAVYLLEREEAAEKHRADGRPREGVIRIETKEPLNVFRDPDDESGGAVASAGGAGDSVDVGGRVVDRGLGEPRPDGRPDNVVDIPRKDVA